MAEDVVTLLVESPVGTAQVAGVLVVKFDTDEYAELAALHTVETRNWYAVALFKPVSERDVPVTPVMVVQVLADASFHCTE